MPSKNTLFMLLTVFGLLHPLFCFAEPQNSEIESTQIEGSAGLDSNFALHFSVKGKQFDLPSPSTDMLEKWTQLPSDEREEFLANRTQFLNLVVKSLTGVKWVLGTGAIIKNELRFRKDLRSLKKLENASLRVDASQAKELQAIHQRYLEEFWQRQEEYRLKSYQQKTREIIESLLLTLDKTLWSEAPLFAHTNEFGFLAAIGAGIEGGVYGKAGWGGLFDIGISIGFNRDKKALAIQIFADNERFQSTDAPAAFISGLVTKAGVYFGNVNKAKDSQGESFYPPAVPGFREKTENLYMGGFSSGGIFSWPPSPLGDLMTYRNKVTNQILVRISLSPILKGFVRIESSIAGKMIGALKTKASNLFGAATSEKRVTFSCSSAHAAGI